MIQIFRLDNPMLGKGLTLPQRLCFFNAMLHFLHGLPRIIFLLAPLPYMYADIYVIYATAASVFAYVIPHMVHTAVTNSILQKGYRYPFLGGVYEAVLSWYILIPTTVALLFPHYGKFNVTAKGGTIGEKYLDWHISWPFVALIALNAAGLMIGLQKAFFDPDPQYVTLVINPGLDRLQPDGARRSDVGRRRGEGPHRFPRVELNLPIVLETSDGVRHAARTAEYSQKELRVRAVDTDFPALAAGDRVAFELAEETGAARFEGVVAEVADGRLTSPSIFPTWPLSAAGTA